MGLSVTPQNKKVPAYLGSSRLVRKGEVLGTPFRKTQFGCELLDPKLTKSSICERVRDYKERRQNK